MYPTNLAIVFAPNILRPLKETPLKLISMNFCKKFFILVGDAGHAAALVRTLIEEASTIFDKAASQQLQEVVYYTQCISCSLKNQDAEDMRKTLRRNYTLHREQSKAAAKTLMRERKMNEEDLVKTMTVAGDNIKAGNVTTIKVC